MHVSKHALPAEVLDKGYSRRVCVTDYTMNKVAGNLKSVRHD
jgi:hypothetical protein